MQTVLTLRHLLMPTDHSCAHFVQIVAVAKTYNELLAWYKSFIVDPYKEMGPSTMHGESIMHTKYFAKGSKLEWYAPADSLELDNDHSKTGFSSIETYEEFLAAVTKETEAQIVLFRMHAQERLDDYRTNIEPKMISYDPFSKPTVQ